MSSAVTYNPFTGTFDFTGDRNVTSIDSNFFVETIVISAAQAAAQAVVLTNTPGDVNKTILDIVSGTSQRFGVDFTVAGNVLSWAGFSLETVLAEGDVIRVTYVI